LQAGIIHLRLAAKINLQVFIPLHLVFKTGPTALAQTHSDTDVTAAVQVLLRSDTLQKPM
jgi:hypothetical protein